MQKKWIKALIILFIQFIFWQVTFKVQTLSNFWFNHITLTYNTVIYKLSSAINFPIGEVFYALIFLIISFTLIQTIRRRSLYLLINLLAIIYFSYNSVWGVAYYKQTFNEKSTDVVINEKGLKKLYCLQLEKAKYYRSAVNSTNQPTKFRLETNDYLEDFRVNEQLLLNENWVYNYKLINKPIIKYSNISKLMNYTGILGYYNPFTIESNINRYDTDLKLPFTIYHELAHQMGFASENQANFVAYFIGIHSTYNEVKYATYYKTMFYLLAAIAKSDPLFVQAEIDLLPLGIKNDRQAEIDYYTKYNGKASEAFSALNDQFLKANNQDGKIAYSRYIELVYYYHQINKGTYN